MIDLLLKLEISILAQVVIFVILIASYHLLQRKLPTYHLLGLSSLRILILILVFFLMLASWSSEVNPSLRAIYVLVMSITNIYLLWQVVLTFKAILHLKRAGSQNQSIKQ